MSRRTFTIAAAIVIALGAAGFGYLLLSDDPAARYTLDTIDDTRNRPFRGVETERDRERKRAAGERLAKDLEAAGRAPSGAGTGRLLTADGLRRALARVRREGARALSLIATPTRVDAVVVGPDGGLRTVRVTAEGTDVSAQGPGPPAGVPLARVADLDPAAPARLARSARGAAVSATVTGTGAQTRWSVTLDSGRTVVEGAG